MISIPGRIPIHIHTFFWVLIAMIGWLNSGSVLGTVIWAAVILVSILIHEYGHALTAVAFGQRAEINLVGLGGLTRRFGKGDLARWSDFLIVLNGPLAGFALFFLSSYALSFVSSSHPLLFYALQVSVEVNLFWTILNLVPVIPLDGGHLMRIFLEGLFGVKGLKVSLFLSILIGVILGLAFFAYQQVIIGILFLMMAFESYRSWSEARGMAQVDSDKHLQNLLQEGVEILQAGRSKDALDKFIEIRNEAPKGLLYVSASQYGARVLAEQGQYKQAYDWLLPLQKRLSPEYLHLLQQVAYRIQEWEEAVKVGTQAYQTQPSLDAALINALSYAIMGEAVPAVGWLRSAVDLGLPNLPQIIEKREFDAIRESAPFQTWLKNQKNS
jgi:Zn-dependent protease